MRSRILLALSCALVSVGSFAAEPSPAATREIQQLLSRLESSGCQFFRNGSWYSGKEARGHLQRKYDYLIDKGLLSTAESFVELGATSSSASGKPYQVRCGGDAGPQPSAAWFRAELERYRSGR